MILGSFASNLLVFSLLLSVSLSYGQADSGGTDFVIVLDVSGSMQSNNLIEPVRDAFNQIIDNAVKDGDTVTLLTFGTAVYDRYPTAVKPSSELNAIREYVNSADFNDDYTYHALAIQTAFEKCSSLQRHYPQHERVILFLTDGENDPPEGLTDEVTLDDVRANDSAYSTDWFVIHVQLNEQDDTEVGFLLSSLFGNHYLFDTQIEDLFSRLSRLLESIVSIRYDPSRDISIKITEKNTAFQGYTDLILSTTGTGEIPVDGLVFQADFPDLPPCIDVSYETEVVSEGRLRVFVKAALRDSILAGDYHGFYIPQLEGVESVWRMGGSAQDIRVAITLALDIDTVDMQIVPPELFLNISEPNHEYQTSFDVDNIPFGMDTSLVAVQFDFREVPDGVTMNYFTDFSVEGRGTVTVSAVAEREVPNGEYRCTALVGLYTNDEFTAERMEIPLTVKTSLVPPVWPKILGAIIAAIALVAGILFFLSQREQKKLFGSLTYWPSDEPGNRKRVDLEQFGVSAVIGHKDVVLRGASGEMATLEVIKTDGNRFVKVVPESGVSLRMNDRKKTAIELHNRDVFQLDNWIFEYSGMTIRRRQPRR